MDLFRHDELHQFPYAQHFKPWWVSSHLRGIFNRFQQRGTSYILHETKRATIHNCQLHRPPVPASRCPRLIIRINSLDPRRSSLAPPAFLQYPRESHVASGFLQAARITRQVEVNDAVVDDVWQQVGDAQLDVTRGSRGNSVRGGDNILLMSAWHYKKRAERAYDATTIPVDTRGAEAIELCETRQRTHVAVDVA